MDEIRPGRLARLLVRFVTRPGYGIGLGTAETMQLAIDEVGAPRILLAAAASAHHQAVRRPRPLLPHRRAAGRGHRRADELHHPALQPGGHPRPPGPDGAARAISAAVGAPVAVIDANDAGCVVLGASPGLDRQLVVRLFADNPARPGPRADADLRGAASRLAGRASRSRPSRGAA